MIKTEICIAVLVYDGLKCWNMVELLEIFVKKEEKYSIVMRDWPEANADFLCFIMVRMCRRLKHYTIISLTKRINEGA